MTVRRVVEQHVCSGGLVAELADLALKWDAVLHAQSRGRWHGSEHLTGTRSLRHLVEIPSHH
uniref:Uncharacterized protein n=1 Tax=uncultured marine virus TaxID=186617 RepID=A0A0F7L6H7_9VIRU|nr:hypothetical protein [uncultured marine virus]